MAPRFFPQLLKVHRVLFCVWSALTRGRAGSGCLWNGKRKQIQIGQPPSPFLNFNRACFNSFNTVCFKYFNTSFNTPQRACVDALRGRPPASAFATALTAIPKRECYWATGRGL